jgi:hypothetical protein
MNSKVITAVGVALLSATLASAAPQSYGDHYNGNNRSQVQTIDYGRNGRADTRQVEQVQRRYRAADATLQVRIDRTEREYRVAVRQNRIGQARQLQRSLQLLRDEQLRNRQSEARETRQLLGSNDRYNNNRRF